VSLSLLSSVVACQYRESFGNFPKYPNFRPKVSWDVKKVSEMPKNEIFAEISAKMSIFKTLLSI
jgi:hypothetical protein